MKKLSVLLMCLALLLQLALMPVRATETDETGEGTVEETTGATQPPVSPAPEVAYGLADITNGCRTVEGMVSLGGNQRILASAIGAFVYEKNTETIVYSLNADEQMYPGSLSQMLTALIVIEKCGLDEVVNVSSRNISALPAGSRHVNLKDGEQLTVEELLYCLVLQNANDAAIALAEHVAGSLDAFVAMMNQRAQEIGCTASNFSNVHGLDHSGQYTTPRDMARIVMAATENETFREIFAANKFTVPATNKSDERALISLNYLIENTIVPKFVDERVKGGKASNTNSAGASLACIATDAEDEEDTEGNMDMVIVVMGATRVFNERGNVSTYGNFEETIELLDYVFGDFEIGQVLYDGQALEQFSVANGTSEVVGQTHDTVISVVPKGARMDKMILKYAVANGGLTAPIAQDQLIATLQIWYQNSCVAETQLYAMSRVESVESSVLTVQTAATRDDANLANVLSFLGVLFLIVAVPAFLYVAYHYVRRVIARNRRRRRRQSRRRSR